MKKFLGIPMFVAAFAAVALTAMPAQAVLINFEDQSVGTTLSNQYSGLGVTFSPNAFSGAGGPTGSWATNTDMTIVSSTGADVGGLGTPALVGGNLLRSFNGWLGEDGDPSFLVSFSTPVTSFSADFAGVSTPAHVRLFVFDGATLLTTVTGSIGTGQFTLSHAAPSITSVKITPAALTTGSAWTTSILRPCLSLRRSALLGFGALTLIRRRR